MTNLACITVPVLGRVLAQWDSITTPHLAAELLTGPQGSELCLRAGRLHVYLTPWAALTPAA